MAGTSRPGPLGRLFLAALLMTAACDGRRSGDEGAPAAAPAAPPPVAEPAPRLPKPTPSPPPVVEAPVEAAPLSEEAQLAEDAAASGMTSSPSPPSVE